MTGSTRRIYGSFVASLALALLLGPLAAAPAAAEGSTDRARVASESQDSETALGDFEKALRASPNDLRLGAEYRQLAIAAEAYDRSLEFWQKLIEENPEAPYAYLNYGYAHVDKVPVEGAITQVILANSALTQFTASLEAKETWIALYTRGNSYLFWPTIFGRTPKGIADLERAIEMSEDLEKKPFHALAHAALGDGHWRLGDMDTARQVWRRGRELFPEDADLQRRLDLEGEALDEFLSAQFDTTKRVETHLRQLFQEG